jgi:trehalose 6-phosphate phosphatase
MEPVSPPPPLRPDCALFLDVDGTLVEIAPKPDAVAVPPRLIALLRTLQERLHGAIALVSGRSVATLDALFAPLILPAAGNHGLERRGADGRISAPEVPRAALDRARAAFSRFAAAHDGPIVEDKGISIALHFRQAPHLAGEAERLAETLQTGLAPALRLQRGKMLVELRPSGGDKGSVVHDFMAETPFAGRVPVFIGDDVTDEDGFRAANDLGGISVRVGEPVGETAARHRIADIGEAHHWLAGLAGTPIPEQGR